MAISGVFFVAPPLTQSLRLFFGILKVFRWCISGTSFIYVWFAVHKFWNFKCFHTSRKYNFRLLLVGFIDVTHRNVVKFIWNFEQWCNATWCTKHVTVFILFLKKPEIEQKNSFLAHFDRFLVYHFLNSVSYTPIFSQIKLLMEVNNCSKIH